MRFADKKAKEQYLKRLALINSVGLLNPFETPEQQRKAIERAKRDIRFCVQRYFPHYATSECAAFQIYFANKVINAKTIKAFAQWGRGLAKSVWCDVIIPFWLWLNNEAHYMVLIGPNEKRAHQLMGDLQAEFETNPQIVRDFGVQKLEGSWEYGNFVTKGCPEWDLKPFIGKALGMGQPVRGLRIGAQRPDLCVIDDVESRELVKNPPRQNEWVKWVESDLIPTMDGPIRRLLYANNRFAPRMIQTELQKKHPTWYVSHVPAYNKVTYEPAWPEKYTPQYYMDLEEEIGRLAALAEFVQEPHISGTIFTEDQIQWAKLPKLKHFKIIVGHWDIAYAGTPTSDFNAVRVWGLYNDNYWYINGFLKQSKMKAAVEWMCQYQKLLPNDVIVHWQYESQFWNDEVKRTIAEVSKAHGVNLWMSPVQAKGNKYNRMLTLQPRYQNSRIYYNEDMYAHNDTKEGLAQLYGIEPGYSGHDDAPDADEHAISFLEKHIPIGSSSGNFQSGKMDPANERL